MSVVRAVFKSWVAPRVVMRGWLAGGAREDRALAVLMAAALLLFVAQWPSLARQAHLDPSVPLAARLAGAGLACLFILPLLAYAIAGLTRLLARGFRGRGSGFGARMALFWSLLAVSPAMLLQGLVGGFLGQGPALALVWVAVFGGFLWLWGNALLVAEGWR
ncbi:MAG: YIP1 family protein [Paracoccaceae bacterium]